MKAILTGADGGWVRQASQASAADAALVEWRGLERIRGAARGQQRALKSVRDNDDRRAL